LGFTANFADRNQVNFAGAESASRGGFRQVEVSSSELLFQGSPCRFRSTQTSTLPSTSRTR
jgi:hypothetical protein